MRRWRHYLRMYGQIQMQNMKSLAEYRTDFLMMVFLPGFLRFVIWGCLGSFTVISLRWGLEAVGDTAFVQFSVVLGGVY
ncbi:hypothetical protein LC724_20310 [Blautia sp. RD014234]|nr:hypothetical protein [Blautia parvula]